MRTPPINKYLYLSVAAALSTIGLKFMAFHTTGSMGYFSDALESLVNLIAAVVALVLLKISQKPADEKHEFGHGKAEYFSSALEGAFILIAAISIIYTSIPRIINPQPLEKVGIGTLYLIAATLINLIVGLILQQKGKKHHSLLLEADGKHLLVDVWTSLGVMGGIALVKITGIMILDPIIAILVALNIVYAGYRLIGRSTSALMDAAIPEEDLKVIITYLDSLKSRNFDYHSLLTRQAGYRKFITFHLLVPGEWSVKQGHDFSEQIEQHIENMFTQRVNVTTHLEPIEDPMSLNDINIDRKDYIDFI